MSAPSGTDGSDWEAVLQGEQYWSDGNYITFTHYWPASGSVSADEIEVIIVTGLNDTYYNGEYFRAEDWGGNPHYAKADRAAHLFYFPFGSEGWW